MGDAENGPQGDGESEDVDNLVELALIVCSAHPDLSVLSRSELERHAENLCSIIRRLLDA